MEEVHGVDVSWLHHPNKEANKHRRAPSASSSNATRPRNTSDAPATHHQTQAPPAPSAPLKPGTANTAPPSSKTAAVSIQAQSQPQPSQPLSKTPPKRPGIGKATSTDDTKSNSRRQSWMNSISSKFSSSNNPERPSTTPPQANNNKSPTSPAAAISPATPTTPQTNGSGPNSGGAVEEAEPYIPSKPKESSFFSSLTRRLSSNSQSGGSPKLHRNGGVCERRILNKDPNRERCLVPEMDPARLRRVSFCVDVEIAGPSRYNDEFEDEDERSAKKKEFKMKERAEGEALKHPEAIKEEKDEEGEPKLEQKSKAVPIPASQQNGNGGSDNVGGSEEKSPPKGSLDDEAAQRRRDKKKKSEEERKERKEKRRRRAEENGQIPVELSLDDQDADGLSGDASPATPTSPTPKFSVPLPGSIPLPEALPLPSSGLQQIQQKQQQQPNVQRPGRPTTDPVRIYRRCCQLRESPILKRITEQLMSPTCCLPMEPGIVNCLDLTGSRLQVADFVTLGDWLAVVPVKKLILEDADLNDEGVRCVLSGLLAAKKPEPSKRKSTIPRHRQGIPRQAHQERAGVVEKLTLKNNPRISRQGWKHISLFIYMCRSIKAIDISMNQFPETLPPSIHSTPVKSPQGGPPNGHRQDIDAAEIMFRCLGERLGGSTLEELILSECGLSAPQLRKIVDGAVMCGITRLGVAGNHLDDEGLNHVMEYLRSGICHGLDIGGNDVRGKLDVVAEALQKNPDLPCWGLSLAGCNLESASLKTLFPALQRLSNFRFIDLSHNKDLFKDNATVSLLRRYIPLMKDLKRIHLADCGISPKQAIALADALADGPQLAHLSLLQNPELSALANAKSEAMQEEACAFYASLMAAVRVSSTLICIDIDVPSQDNSEVVKALAKQVVAYCLRNMEQFAIAEATGNAIPTANATTALTSAYGGESGVKDVVIPDVLMQLVGHVDGYAENHDNDDPAPDDDYIVGGTGVVKALQYVLGEKANDRRISVVSSGTSTPTQRPGSSAGLTEEQRGKAKKMSKNLLGSARNIRDRLQPALAKEAATGDEMAYRRLLFLDQTLQSMIQRFEEEYPETRLAPAPASPSAVSSEADTSSMPSESTNLTSIATDIDPAAASVALESDEEEDDMAVHPTRVSRHNSDVSLASRAQIQEEGRLHRIGQQLRRDVIDSPRSGVAEGASLPPWKRDSPGPSPAKGGKASPSPASSPLPADKTSNGTSNNAATTAAQIPTSQLTSSTTLTDSKQNRSDSAEERERERIRRLGETFESISGYELKKQLVDERSYEKFLAKFGSNFEDLRRLQEEDPEAWELFKESQAKARLNVGRA